MTSVNKWTMKKWEFLGKYLHAYTTIISCYFKQFYYIDAFSGIGKYGKHDGSPLLALNLEFPFTDYIFIEKDPTNFAELKKNVSIFSNRKAYTLRNGPKESKKQIMTKFYNIDAIEYINNHLQEIKSSTPCFIFLDPYGIKELDMHAVSLCSSRDKTELLINFSVMGIIRNVGNKQLHPLLTRYYGNEEWKKLPNKAVNREGFYADLYIKSLKKYFKYVVAHVIRNDLKRSIYYLIHTTNNPNGSKIMKDVMRLKDKQSKLTKF